MAEFLDGVKVSTATTGTGSPITLGAAASGFLTFAQGGAVDGRTYRYAIRDGANSEWGYGVYNSGAGTLTRNVVKSTNSNNAIDLSGSATVFIYAGKDDIQMIPMAARETVTSGSAALFYLSNVVPQMTSNSSGGAVASASTEYPGALAWEAFTNNISDRGGWLTNAAATGWLKIQLPSAEVVYGYSLIGWSPDTFPARCPKAWTVEGSNDGSAWTTLDTRSNISSTMWAQWQEKFFTIASPASYSYYRITVTENTGDSYLGVSQFALYGEADPPAGGFSGLCVKLPDGEIQLLSRRTVTL